MAVPGLSTTAPDALTLVLVRHGRTRFNADGRIQGWSDSEITQDGWVAVDATAEALADLRLRAAYASPLGRTVATATRILDRHPHLTLERHDGLREFHFGIFEERPEAELVAHVDWFDLFAGVLEGDHPGLPGGESARDYLARVSGAFSAIERAHGPGETVLVVSHGMTLMAYLAMSGIAPEGVLANASVTVVRVADGVRTAVVVGHDPSRDADEPTDLLPRAEAIAAREVAADADAAGTDAADVNTADANTAGTGGLTRGA